jgi:hypothetical protein
MACGEPVAGRHHQFPDMPAIGLPESDYAQLARTADRAGDLFGREAAKVGQYVTLALDPYLDWTAKRRYFEHAIRRRCKPPPVPNEEIWMFYQQLADLVRKYAGEEMLRVASIEDEHYVLLEKGGMPRRKIAEKANEFFKVIIGEEPVRPEWLHEEDWRQLRLIWSQWK